MYIKPTIYGSSAYIHSFTMYTRKEKCDIFLAKQMANKALHDCQRNTYPCNLAYVWLCDQHTVTNGHWFLSRYDAGYGFNENRKWETKHSYQFFFLLIFTIVSFKSSLWQIYFLCSRVVWIHTHTKKKKIRWCKEIWLISESIRWLTLINSSSFRFKQNSI